MQARDEFLIKHTKRFLKAHRVYIKSFAKQLNQQCLASLPDKALAAHGIDNPDAYQSIEQYLAAETSFLRRLERWMNGTINVPIWLEEPWVQALEALGDLGIRPALQKRYGYLPVKNEQAAGLNLFCLGQITQEYGRYMQHASSVLDDKTIDDGDDLQDLQQMSTQIRLLIGELMPQLMRLESEIEKRKAIKNPDVCKTSGLKKACKKNPGEIMHNLFDDFNSRGKG